MSARLEGGGRPDQEAFLSAHRCPEVELLPHHKSEARIPPPGSASADQPDPNYLDVSSTPHRDEEEDGTISDWSEEDLSLHFSPSVIISSDDEESEATFECVDITVETLVNGQEGEGPKMVPKRQIQLKKREDDTVKEQKPQVKREAAEGQDGGREVARSPGTRQRPELLLRQHSMPASTASGDADSHRAYRGLVAGANHGLHVGGNPKQRLQKSFSLDETKAKMASCIIKSVLSKKMQAEQSRRKAPQGPNQPGLAADLPQAGEQQRAKEGGGGGGETGGGVAKAPLHVVRDMRSLVKNTYSHTLKAVAQGGSPPPSYQQAVGVKVHKPSKNSLGGTAKPAAASLVQRNQRNGGPIPQQGRGSQPIRRRSQRDDVRGPGAPAPAPESPESPSKSSGAESAGAGGQGAGAPSSTQEPSAVLGGPPQLVPGNPRQIFHPCFYTPASLPPFAPTVLRHVGKVSYLHAPLSYIQTQLQPNLHLLPTPEENQSSLPGTLPARPVRSPPQRTTGGQKSGSAAATPETPRQQAEEQQLPAAQGCDHALGDAANLAAPSPGALANVPPNLQCFYVDMAPQSQRKMLLDPETGQYVQVFLPAPRTAPSSGVYPLGLANPAPFAPAAVNPAPAILSVMQLQPAVAVSPFYAPPFLPFPLNPPSINFTHTPL